MLPRGAKGIHASNSLDDQYKNLQPQTLNNFKNKIYSINNPLSNNYHKIAGGRTGIWLSRLRMGLSGLNAHRFNYNFIQSPLCDHCQLGNETTTHYFFWCPVYGVPRAVLMDELRLNLNINTNNQSLLLQTILNGTGNAQDDKNLIKYLGEYFLATNRFK